MTTCERTGCGGTIVDGYCDRCGLAPSKTVAGPSEPFNVTRLTSQSRSSSNTTRRSRVGAGVVDVAPMTVVDPATVVMADPSVPESRRFCPQCQGPVGRAKGDRPGRQSGFCPTCGTRFDFAAKLRAGELVAGQYEVVGALAHGGLGWIYLVRDRNVSGRWCVLKGLLDTADPDAAEAAVAERRFLAEVTHPAIVDIFNFVNHDGQGYIVMEYVGGPSLKQLTKRRREEGLGPLPVPEAAAFLLAVLPAIGFLHDRGLVYCDFKPDNVIHVEDSVKLIDLGGVRRLNDPDAAIFGTVGYQAPEVPVTGPTVASDLYTVGRALAVLILDWPAWQTTDREQLPDRRAHALLLEHDGLWRFLQRACAADPAQRFADAEEMADNLHGVLCHVAAASDGVPRPRTSTRFTPPRARIDAPDWRALPTPLLPNHPRLANRVAGIAEGDAVGALAMAAGGDELSWADAAAVVRAHCDLMDWPAAQNALEHLDPLGPDAEGVTSALSTARAYLEGVIALAQGDPTRAAAHFDAAYASAPGEAACVLALATSLEVSGDVSRATDVADLYEQVAVSDPSWVPAVGGLARALQALRRPTDAARVLVAVPDSHPSRAEALTLACQQMETSQFDTTVADEVGERLRATPPGGRSAADARLAIALFRAALVGTQRGDAVGDRVAGTDATTPSNLARAIEENLLELADATPDRTQRHELLDAAARTRPWSIW